MCVQLYIHTVTQILNSGFKFKKNQLHIKEHIEIYIERKK